MEAMLTHVSAGTDHLHDSSKIDGTLSMDHRAHREVACEH